MAKLSIGEVISDTIVVTGEWLVRALPLGILAAIGGGMGAYGNAMENIGLPRPGYLWGGLILEFAASLLLGAAILRGILRKDWRGPLGARLGQDEGLYFVSSLAIMVIWLLILLIVMLPVVLACMVILAGSGIDLDTLSSSVGWARIAGTPAWYGGLLVFILGLFTVIALMMRSIPYAAGSIDRRKIVAMEAFQWTKGNTLRLLAIFVGLFIPLMVIMWVGARLTGLLAAGIGEAANTVILPTKAAHQIPLLSFESLFSLPGTVAFVVLSAEVYRRVRPDAVDPRAFD